MLFWMSPTLSERDRSREERKELLQTRIWLETSEESEVTSCWRSFTCLDRDETICSKDLGVRVVEHNLHTNLFFLAIVDERP